MKFDMHFHSNRSDGPNSPEEIIAFAKKWWITFLNFTDHDVLTSQEVLSLAWESDIITFPSTEISAKDYKWDKSLHLTYYAQDVSSNIESILSNTRCKRKEMIWSQLKKLLEKGFQWNMKGFYTYFKWKWRNLETLNKFDIAEYLYTYDENKDLVEEIIWEKDFISFYRKCLREEWELYREYWDRIDEYEPSVERCWELAWLNEAILSIAHPHYTFSRIWEKWFAELITRYVDMWVNAIEIHSRTPKPWIELIYELKQKYNLLLTAWSDNHWLSDQDNKHSLLWDLNPFLWEEKKSSIAKSCIKFLEK